MSKNPPVFRQIGAPLDVSDDDLNALGEQLGVPTMVKPQPHPAPAVSSENSDRMPQTPAHGDPSPAQPPLPPKIDLRLTPPRRQTEKITVELPSYLASAVRRAGVERRTTARTLIVMGLQALGFEVDEQDLIPDGRRARPRRMP